MNENKNNPSAGAENSGDLSPIAVRTKRNMTALSLHEPDRVPFMPSMNNFYCLHYGVTVREMMTHPQSLMEPLQKYLKDYDPDWVWNPIPFPIKPMETVGSNQCRWPGPYWDLPDNTPYQYVDKEFLTEDDWDEYLEDPTLFIMHKVLPKKYKNLEGLQYINPYAMTGHCILNYGQFANPKVQEALQTLLKAGKEVGEFMEEATPLTMSVIEAGYPVYGGCPGCIPFDDFADSVRGLMQLCMDVITDPDYVEEVLQKWGDVTIPAAIAGAKAAHCDDLFLPLHCGTDNFMSIENYEKYYWPTLKRTIMAAIDAGLTPIVFCEGKYDTRLECISDVPPGKVLYNFENVDFKEAKRILNGHAAIGGGMDTHILLNGTPEQVEYEVRRTLDILAPGGGYFMSNSIALDNVSPENMHAWRNAVEKYGKY